MINCNYNSSLQGAIISGIENFALQLTPIVCLSFLTHFLKYWFSFYAGSINLNYAHFIHTTRFKFSLFYNNTALQLHSTRTARMKWFWPKFTIHNLFKGCAVEWCAHAHLPRVLWVVSWCLKSCTKYCDAAPWRVPLPRRAACALCTALRWASSPQLTLLLKSRVSGLGSCRATTLTSFHSTIAFGRSVSATPRGITTRWYNIFSFSSSHTQRLD